MKKRSRKQKKNKNVKLNKNFSYFLAAAGIFLAVKGLQGLSGGATAAVIGASSTDVALVSFGSFFVGAFLTLFGFSQILQHK